MCYFRLLKTCILTAFILAFLPTATTGCKKIKQEETLKVATVLHKDEVFLYLTDFKRHNPNIRVELEFLDENNILDAISRPEEKRPDVLWGVSAITLSIARDKGLLQEYEPKRLEKLDSRYYDKKSKIPTWAGMRIYVTAFVTSEHGQLKEKFDTPRLHKDLLNPSFQRDILGLNPETGGGGFIFVSNILQNMGEDAGWKYLEALDRNIKAYYDDSSAPPKQIGKSNGSLGITVLTRANAELKKGAPIIVSVPDDGAAWDIEANAVVRKTGEIPQKVKNFIDWTFTPTMMKMYSRNYPVVTDTEIEKEMSDENWGRRIVLPKNDIEWATENKADILRKWNEKIASKRPDHARTTHNGIE